MSVLAEFTIPARAVALATTLRRLPDLRVELCRLVACADDRPFVRTRNVAAKSITPALEADPSTDDAARLTGAADRRRSIYRVEWADGSLASLDALSATGAVVEAVATDGRWHLTTMYDDRARLTEAYERCDAPLEVRTIRDLSAEVSANGSSLTDSQFEAISTAFERNFYDIPRAVTLEDLATDLGVSHQAVSERLRRSHRALVSRAVDERS